jgi:hypothetical protein
MTVTIILIPGDLQCVNESGVSGQASFNIPSCLVCSESATVFSDHIPR